MFCKNCGKEISDGAKFCKYCGNQIQHIVLQEKEKPKKKHLFLKISGIAVLAVVVLVLIDAFASDSFVLEPLESFGSLVSSYSNPIDKSIDKMESAVQKVEKLADRMKDFGNYENLNPENPGAVMVEIAELSKTFADAEKDFNEALDSIKGYEDSDFTEEQWNRIFELMERLSAAGSKFYY